MDHHVHTNRCHHAEGTCEEYIETAIALGHSFIGFNDHFPLRYLPLPLPVEKYAMELDEFPGYIAELHELHDRYRGTIEVRISAEVDYYAPAIDEIGSTLATFQDDFDYLYGSVHVVDDWAVDDDMFLDKWNETTVDAVYDKYYDNLLGMVNSGLFKIVGHFDLPKKFRKFPTIDFTDKILSVLDAIKAMDMVVELNTAGARKPVGEFYPSPAILELCHENGIKITLGSDAHDAAEVGYKFPEAIELLKSVGFPAIYSYSKMKQYRIDL
jgi:histidinol-phosphatase (PHP family)